MTLSINAPSWVVVYIVYRDCLNLLCSHCQYGPDKVGSNYATNYSYMKASDTFHVFDKATFLNEWESYLASSGMGRVLPRAMQSTDVRYLGTKSNYTRSWRAGGDSFAGPGQDQISTKHEKPRKSGVIKIGRVRNKLAYIITTHIIVPADTTATTAIAATVHQTHTLPIFWAIVLMLFSSYP